MNSRHFVRMFVVVAILFSVALLWSAKLRPHFKIAEYTDTQISGDFLAHVSKGFVRKDVPLVQLQQIEVIEAPQLAAFNEQYAFLKKVDKLHVNVIYNYVIDVDDKVLLSRSENGDLKVSSGPLRLLEPIVQLNGTRVQTVNDIDVKITDEEMTSLLKNLHSMIVQRGEERKISAKTAAQEELVNQLSGWVRVKNLNPVPGLSAVIE